MGVSCVCCHPLTHAYWLNFFWRGGSHIISPRVCLSWWMVSSWMKNISSQVLYHEGTHWIKLAIHYLTSVVLFLLSFLVWVFLFFFFFSLFLCSTFILVSLVFSSLSGFVEGPWTCIRTIVVVQVLLSFIFGLYFSEGFLLFHVCWLVAVILSDLNIHVLITGHLSILFRSCSSSQCNG